MTALPTSPTVSAGSPPKLRHQQNVSIRFLQLSLQFYSSNRKRSSRSTFPVLRTTFARPSMKPAKHPLCCSHLQLLTDISCLPIAYRLSQLHVFLHPLSIPQDLLNHSQNRLPPFDKRPVLIQVIQPQYRFVQEKIRSFVKKPALFPLNPHLFYGNSGYTQNREPSRFVKQTHSIERVST